MGVVELRKELLIRLKKIRDLLEELALIVEEYGLLDV